MSSVREQFLIRDLERCKEANKRLIDERKRDMAAGVPVYSASDLQAAIEKERKECWQRVVESKQHMKANHIDYSILRDAILGKAGLSAEGLNTDKEGES